jgi:hypothetical protein
MPTAKIELKKECIRLRLEERLSLREIEAKTGASKGSLSSWLREFPLTHDEKKARRVGPPVPQKKDRGEESEIHRIVRVSKLNGVQVAKVSETAVMLRMLVRGFNVFGSMFDGEKADWVVEIYSGKIFKVQVKTAKQGKHGLPSVELTHGNSSRLGSQRYVEGDFDFIVGYDIFTDTAYVWSWNEVAHLKTAVSVSENSRENWDKFRR